MNSGGERPPHPSWAAPERRPFDFSVCYAETRLSISAKSSSDGNEVKATLESLLSLDLKRCTVTAYSLHFHPAMSKAVRAPRAHYALKLKCNNLPLSACAAEAFEKADAAGKSDSY